MKTAEEFLDSLELFYFKIKNLQDGLPKNNVIDVMKAYKAYIDYQYVKNEKT